MSRLELDDYTLHEALGEGASGTVFRGTHRASGAAVAVKVVSAHDPRLAAAVEQEVRAMARVNHPNLLAVYDHGRLEGGEQVWLAVEYASGGSLEGWLPADWDELTAVLDDVLAGLSHAHARGLVHRDLKPANLLRALPSDGFPGVKIGDFGLTVIRDVDPVVRRGGTPLYMAPEQLRRDGVPTAASDLYGLGGMLWHWVTGAPPFQGEGSELVTQHRHASLPVFRPRFQVPVELEGVLRRLLAKEPEARPATVGEVRRGLRQDHPSVARAMARVTARAAIGQRLPGVGLRVLLLRDHALLGRQKARKVLVRALDEVRRTEVPQVWLVSGAPGIGASRLARWVGETAEEAGLARLLWAPDRDVAREEATRQPVVALYDPADGATESTLAELSFARGPLLVVATRHAGERWAELESRPNVHRLELGPLDAETLRELLVEQLGFAGGASLQVEPMCERVPGRAVSYVAQLATEGRLASSPDGFVVTPGPLPPPPPPSRLGAQLVTTLVARASDSDRRALRLGAVLGAEMADEVWRRILRAEGLGEPADLLGALAGAGQLVRRGEAWAWSEVHLPEVVLGDGGTPSEHLAASRALAGLPQDPVLLAREGLHLLRAGLVAEARAVLLTRRPGADLALMQFLATLLPELAAHMDGASGLERYHLRTQQLRCRMNLVSPFAAVEDARALAEAIGTSEGPGELWYGLSEDERREGVELAAITLALSDLGEEALQVLESIEPGCRGLRVRGMVASDLGDPVTAVAWYQKALASTDDPALRGRVMNGMGGALGTAGDLEQSAVWFRRSAEHMEPELRYTPLQNLARVMITRGRPDEAIDPAREALELADRHVRHRGSAARLIYTLAAALLGQRSEVERLGDRALYDQRRYGHRLGEPLCAVIAATTSPEPMVERFLRAVESQERQRLKDVSAREPAVTG